MHHKLIVVSAAATLALLVGPGCKKNQNTSNSDLLGMYASEHKYEDGPEMPEHYESGGKSVSIATMNAIEDAILEVYVHDFERCLEKEMERFDNRWIAGTFDIDILIETSGKVTKVELMEVDVKERKLAKGQKEMRVASNFESCVKQLAMQWEFDPAPEANYEHTHKGKVGEAY